MTKIDKFIKRNLDYERRIHKKFAFKPTKLTSGHWIWMVTYYVTYKFDMILTMYGMERVKVINEKFDKQEYLMLTLQGKLEE